LMMKISSSMSKNISLTLVFTYDEFESKCCILAKPWEINQRKNYKQSKDHYIMILRCEKRQNLINLSETLSLIQVYLVDTSNVQRCQTFPTVKTLIWNVNDWIRDFSITTTKLHRDKPILELSTG
jgi:hypothetical protein